MIFLHDSVKDAFQYSHEYCVHEHSVQTNTSSKHDESISHCLKESRRAVYEF